VAAPASLPPNPLTVAFMDSGQGDSTLVVSPRGRLMLVDCGAIKSSRVVLAGIAATLARYLPTTGGVIDRVVITHPDQDHYNMLVPVLEATRATVKDVWIGGEVDQYRNNSAAERNRTYDWLVARRVRPLDNVLYEGARRAIDFDGVELFRLAANATNRREDDDLANENSIVLMLRYAEYRIFLMGDATAFTEQFILDSVRASGPPGLLDNTHATTLKMGHHGSTTSSAQPWVSALRPNGLAVSADTRKFGRPGTGMPSVAHLRDVIGWSGNIAPAARHTCVLFAGPRFVTQSYTTAVFSTLTDITYLVPDDPDPPTNGASLFWFVGSNGQVVVQTTQP
jgi:beta-lactamase superfamily II metal-dependent hydrolase